MTTLYRFFGEDGTLLYVGISDRAIVRMAEHEIGKPWWPEVRSATFENYALRDHAEQAETRAIRSEHPVYNVRDNLEPGVVTDYEARRERRAFAEIRKMVSGLDYTSGPYTLPCPRCGASDFEPCKTLHGSVVDEPHRPRIWAYEEAFCSKCGAQITQTPASDTGARSA